MKKIIALTLCVLTLLTVTAPVCLAAESDDEIMITLDVNERYTDISEMNEDDPYLSKSEETLEKERNKKVYIAVLVILLVVSLGVLVYTLKKVPSEKEIEDKDTAELLSNNSEEKEE
jgi:hypothetical protein